MIIRIEKLWNLVDLLTIGLMIFMEFPLFAVDDRVKKCEIRMSDWVSVPIYVSITIDNST